MTRHRGTERGVVKVASSLLFAGAFALLGMAGCSAGDASGDTPVRVEDLGTSRQAITCTIKGLGCPADSNCGDWTCPALGGECTVKPGDTDGSRCESAEGKGICAGNACCTSGCIQKTKLGGYVCRPGTDDTACGGPVTTCQNCVTQVTDQCVTGVCNADRRVCEKQAAPPNTSCSDGDVCNGAEVCNGTSCEAGNKLNCDDGQECTIDSCDAAGGCMHTPRTGEVCSDGDACTTDDKCGADGLCKPGTQINCNDGQTCTKDSCAEGKCVNTPVASTTSCNDGDPCTENDKCVMGKCQGTSVNGVNCDDGKACTADKQVACNSMECSHTPLPVETPCPAADKCHENGHCSGTDDTCVQGPELNCDDSNPCTIDSCDPSTGCTHRNDASADCSDGDPCTENDACVAGVCGGKLKKCLALDACHEPGTCNGETGACDDPRSDDGKECPGGTCQSGKCSGDPSAVGGQGAGGDSGVIGGSGGEGNSPGAGGEATTPSGGKGGTDTDNDAGEAIDPSRVFQREPGGCSCDVPASKGSSAAWLVGLGVGALVVARRRRLSSKRVA